MEENVIGTDNQKQTTKDGRGNIRWQTLREDRVAMQVFRNFVFTKNSMDDEGILIEDSVCEDVKRAFTPVWAVFGDNNQQEDFNHIREKKKDDAVPLVLDCGSFQQKIQFFTILVGAFGKMHFKEVIDLLESRLGDSGKQMSDAIRRGPGFKNRNRSPHLYGKLIAKWSQVDLWKKFFPRVGTEYGGSNRARSKKKGLEEKDYSKFPKDPQPADAGLSETQISKDMQGLLERFGRMKDGTKCVYGNLSKNASSEKLSSEESCAQQCTRNYMKKDDYAFDEKTLNVKGKNIYRIRGEWGSPQLPLIAGMSGTAERLFSFLTDKMVTNTHQKKKLNSKEVENALLVTGAALVLGGHHSWVEILFPLKMMVKTRSGAQEKDFKLDPSSVSVRAVLKDIEIPIEFRSGSSKVPVVSRYERMMDSLIHRVVKDVAADYPSYKERDVLKYLKFSHNVGAHELKTYMGARPLQMTKKEPNREFLPILAKESEDSNKVDKLADVKLGFFELKIPITKYNEQYLERGCGLHKRFTDSVKKRTERFRIKPYLMDVKTQSQFHRAYAKYFGSSRLSNGPLLTKKKKGVTVERVALNHAVESEEELLLSEKNTQQISSTLEKLVKGVTESAHKHG